MSRLDEIRARLAAATPGPWRWEGNVDAKQVNLSTVDRGRLYIMSFFRWGMGGAAPYFRATKPGEHGMKPVTDFVVREREYRGDVDHLDHPDAELIANAPADIEFLLGEVERLTVESALAAVEAARYREALDTIVLGTRENRGLDPAWGEIASAALEDREPEGVQAVAWVVESRRQAAAERAALAAEAEGTQT